MTSERAIAYSEVYAILEKMKPEYIDKIPNKFKTMIIEEMDKTYKPKIDINIPLKEQKITSKALTILAMINLNYWCTNDKHKSELIELYAKNDKIQEQRLKEKYNTDNIFKKREKEETIPESNVSKENAIIEYKEQNLIQRLFEKIKHLFKRKY